MIFYSHFLGRNDNHSSSHSSLPELILTSVSYPVGSLVITNCFRHWHIVKTPQGHMPHTSLTSSGYTKNTVQNPHLFHRRTNSFWKHLGKRKTIQKQNNTIKMPKQKAKSQKWPNKSKSKNKSQNQNTKKKTRTKSHTIKVHWLPSDTWPGNAVPFEPSCLTSAYRHSRITAEEFSARHPADCLHCHCTLLQSAILQVSHFHCL